MQGDKSAGELLNDLFKKKTWDDFFRTPCVRSSYLWGVGCASVIMAHKLRMYRGNVQKAMNAGILTFVGVSAFSFLACAREIEAKHEMIREAFKAQNIQEDSSWRDRKDKEQ